MKRGLQIRALERCSVWGMLRSPENCKAGHFELSGPRKAKSSCATLQDVPPSCAQRPRSNRPRCNTRAIEELLPHAANLQRGEWVRLAKARKVFLCEPRGPYDLDLPS